MTYQYGNEEEKMKTYYLIKQKVNTGYGIIAVRYRIVTELPEKNFETLIAGTLDECKAPIVGTYLDPEVRRPR